MVDLSDTVSAAQDGCPEAFSTLVRETYDDTYSLALRLVGNADDANDVVQDTYLRAFAAIRRFRGDAQIGTWLYRITANTASTLVQRRRKHSHDELAGDASLPDDCQERNPELRAENSDVRAQLLAALAALPTKLRSVVVLRDIYDLPHDAIAEQLGISESAAKVRLHRARLKLREQLFGSDLGFLGAAQIALTVNDDVAPPGSEASGRSGNRAFPPKKTRAAGVA